jgi:hypothetical protein
MYIYIYIYTNLILVSSVGMVLAANHPSEVLRARKSTPHHGLHHGLQCGDGYGVWSVRIHLLLKHRPLLVSNGSSPSSC